MDTKNIRIAAVTDDGTTISAHFGRARYYEVVTVQDGKVANRERREKAGHHVFAAHESSEPHGHGPHGFGPDSERKHSQMTDTISDCDMLLARGMGMGAHTHLATRGITPILTTLRTIDEGVAAVIGGTIADHPERLH